MFDTQKRSRLAPASSIVEDEDMFSSQGGTFAEFEGSLRTTTRDVEVLAQNLAASNARQPIARGLTAADLNNMDEVS